MGEYSLKWQPTFEFMTAAAFEARLCPTWLNEIKKTKFYTYTKPAAGINFLLAAVGHLPVYLVIHYLSVKNSYLQFGYILFGCIVVKGLGNN
jgi:hypothetical protein